MIYIKNCRENKALAIRRIRVGGAALNRFHVYTVRQASPGSIAGTEIDGQNMSRLSLRKTPEGDCESYGNAAVTGLVQRATIDRIRIQSSDSEEAFYEAGKFLLGENNAMAVYSDSSGDVEVTIEGEYI